MPNAVVTSTSNSVKVVFNDMSTAAGMDKGAWAKEDISVVKLKTTHVEVITHSTSAWDIHYTGTDYMIVDTVDGASPSSLSDLYDKIVALIA